MTLKIDRSMVDDWMNPQVYSSNRQTGTGILSTHFTVGITLSRSYVSLSMLLRRILVSLLVCVIRSCSFLVKKTCQGGLRVNVLR